MFCTKYFAKTLIAICCKYH